MASIFARKRVDRYLDILVALQDTLGHANDAATAERLLATLAPPERFALFARGWLAAGAAGDPAAHQALVKSLRRTRRFWRKKAQAPAS